MADMFVFDALYYKNYIPSGRGVSKLYIFLVFHSSLISLMSLMLPILNVIVYDLHA